MSKAHTIAHIIIAGVTPTLVLLNSLQGTASFSSSITEQPIKPIAHPLSRQLENIGPGNLVPLYSPTSDADANASQTQARIVEQNGERFLEFYRSFSTAAQAPSLMLVLDSAKMPDTTAPNPNFAQSDRHYMVGELRPLAGMQRYPIPTSVNVAQYLSVIIWCPELDAIMGYAPLTLEV